MSESAVRPLALVTGASTGIGLELAKQFAQHGFDLVVAWSEAPTSAPAFSRASRMRDSSARVSTSHARW